MTNARDRVSRFAAIGEICLVLVVGNLVGRALVPTLISPELAAIADTPEAPDLLPAAGVSALQLTARFGAMMLLGFTWLWWRSRKTPRDCGFTRSGWPLSRLLTAGVVLYAVSFLPLLLLLISNAYLPLGAGLAEWHRDAATLANVDFWIFVLCAAVILPPIYEELIFRGYMRERISENFGPMGAIIATAFLFSLAHGQYYAADILLTAALACSFFAAFCWAYVTYRCGSLLPAMVAHALTNLPIPHEPLVLFPILIASAIVILLARETIVSYLGTVLADWRGTDKGGVLLAMAVITAFVVPASVLNASAMQDEARAWGIACLIVFGAAVGWNWRRSGGR
jgi:membrane protease YdiL (CAAX protease family)